MVYRWVTRWETRECIKSIELCSIIAHMCDIFTWRVFFLCRLEIYDEYWLWLIQIMSKSRYLIDEKNRLKNINYALFTCLLKTATSSLNESDEQTSPPATPGSRGVHVANSHFSNINANRGKSGCLQMKASTWY